MSTAQNKTSIKTLLSLIGLASASVFLSFPAIAETSTGCGSYRGNATTGGGYYCALGRINGQYYNRDASTMDRQSTNNSMPSGNGVTSNSGSNSMESQSTTSSPSTMDRQYPTTQSSTVEQRSTTTTSYPPNRVTPNTGTNTMEQPQPSPTTVNQSTDQGVRALW